jgi:sec-independent protein translocase protein TatB
VFGIAPEKLLVLLAVGFILLGPDRMPQIARDAARMLRTLRDLASGTRQQLTDELGPEFANFDLASLNPRTAIQRALDFGADDPTPIASPPAPGTVPATPVDPEAT